MSGLEVEKLLTERFWRDSSILGTSISDVRTMFCQNKCSGHGVCNSETRACMCDTFWMPDIFYFWGIGSANCGIFLNEMFAYCLWKIKRKFNCRLVHPVRCYRSFSWFSIYIGLLLGFDLHV